ncbi:uncharacterized protein PHALS_13409 [Plasmopara halstedii]|uniref:Uncharacterized protein n=1 Tax=Plasmopara halstedii TaxID=4781 RepID=A0A0N7L638_PLAHL|nr:uncharacterized protein PHALS_13409 [Plasmopara halstedii]CEG43195.1 hypothetical protein PHALS_13409 [Plasmopara halstedii]|eukprot:XP_024579564.1 hypothetical protein PHALS_13409 [Plasmopara halstedii]
MRNNVTIFEDSDTIITAHMEDKTKKLIQEAYKKDSSFGDVFRGDRQDKRFVKINGLIYLSSDNKSKRLCISDDDKIKVAILHNSHDAASAAHPGWNNMQQDVRSTPKLVKRVPDTSREPPRRTD